MYGEPRVEVLNPFGLLRADPTFEVTSDEHSDVLASGGGVWTSSSSGVRFVRSEGCDAGAECGAESSPSQDCVNIITLDGRSFFSLALFSVAVVEFVEHDGRVAAGPQ